MDQYEEQLLKVIKRYAVCLRRLTFLQNSYAEQRSFFNESIPSRFVFDYVFKRLNKKDDVILLKIENCKNGNSKYIKIVHYEKTDNRYYVVDTDNFQYGDSAFFEDRSEKRKARQEKIALSKIVDEAATFFDKPSNRI